MANMPRRSVNRAEAQLAFYAAGRALGVPIDLDQLRALAELTHNLDDVNVTIDMLVTAKKNAPAGQGVDVKAIVRVLEARASGSGGHT